MKKLIYSTVHIYLLLMESYIMSWIVKLTMEGDIDILKSLNDRMENIEHELDIVSQRIKK